MAAAAVIPILEVLAFALVAIAAIDLINTFVVQPLQRGQSMVSGLPVLGGPLAWLVGQLVLAVQIALSAMSWIANQGKNDAFNAWSSLLTYSVGAVYSYQIAWSTWVGQNSGAIEWMITHWNQLWSQAFSGLPYLLQGVSDDLRGLHWWIDNVLVARVGGIGNDLAGLHSWIDNVELPFIRGIGDDLAGLHRWIDANVVQHAELQNAQAATLARVTSLVVPIETAITDIENSPCMKVCDPLGEVGQLLQGLEDAGMIAILLGLMAEVRSDPGAAQTALRSVVMPIIDDAVSSLGVS